MIQGIVLDIAIAAEVLLSGSGMVAICSVAWDEERDPVIRGVIIAGILCGLLMLYTGVCVLMAIGS